MVDYLKTKAAPERSRLRKALADHARKGADELVNQKTPLHRGKHGAYGIDIDADFWADGSITGKVKVLGSQELAQPVNGSRTKLDEWTEAVVDAIDRLLLQLGQE